MKKTLQELEREKSILEKRIYNLKNREYYNVHKIGRLRDRVLQIDNYEEHGTRARTQRTKYTDR